MSVLDAILLGLIQGLSEFLPISSTAHLTLAGKAMGLVSGGNPEAWTAFMAVMQLGTLAAILVFFARDLWTMSRSFVGDIVTLVGGGEWKGWSRDSALILYMILGTIPVAVAGLKMEQFIEGELTKSILFISYMMVLWALFLWLAETSAQHDRSLASVTWKDALVIGLAQVLALLPGASRAGTTITAALFLGIRRSAAARFSFLLSIPAVFASGLLELSRLLEMLQAGGGALHFGVLNLVVATLVSGITGYVAIAWLLSYLVKYTTFPFVTYRLVLGTGLLLMVAGGVISAR